MWLKLIHLHKKHFWSGPRTIRYVTHPMKCMKRNLIEQKKSRWKCFDGIESHIQTGRGGAVEWQPRRADDRRSTTTQNETTDTNKERKKRKNPVPSASYYSLNGGPYIHPWVRFISSNAVLSISLKWHCDAALWYWTNTKRWVRNYKPRGNRGDTIGNRFSLVYFILFFSFCILISFLLSSADAVAVVLRSQGLLQATNNEQI